MKKQISLLLIFCATILILYIVFSKQKNTDPETIKIGAIIPLTGETATHGIRVKHGIELALERINANGGIRGKQLEVVFQDDQCDSAKAIAAFQALSAQGINIFLGPQCSSAAMAVAPLAEQQKNIVFASMASVPALSEQGDYIFRNSESGHLHGSQMAEFAYTDLRAKTAAILYINLDNGVAYKDSFNTTFTAIGGKVLVIEAYEKGTADFKTQLTKIKKSSPDVIYIAGQAAEHAVRQIRELGIASKIVSMNGIEVPELFKVAGKAAEGIYFTSAFFDAQSTGPQVAAFVTEYNKRYEEGAEVFSANGYDAAMIIGESMRSCGIDTTCIKDYLYSIKNYPGISGLINFDKNGDVQKQLAIKHAKNGAFVIYRK